MPRKDTNTGPISAQAQQDLVSEGIENFELPKSIVTRIAKSAVPESTKLQKETILSLIKGSTVFINYLAATAHHVALSKQHKSISASDVIKALELIELGDLADKLQEELVIYRELAKNDKSKKGTSNISAAKNRSASSASAAGSSTISKSKGKEKALPESLPAPFTSAPLPHPGYLNESISTGPGMAMDVDGYDDPHEEDFAGDVDPDVEGELDPEGPEGIEDEVEADEEEEEEPDEEEELVDTVALEEEEVRKDARGLEDPVQPVTVDHDMDS